MKKVLIIVSVVVIALAGIGVGTYFLTREKSPEEQVVGTWYDGENDVTIELKSNKSMKITKESGESRAGIKLSLLQQVVPKLKVNFQQERLNLFSLNSLTPMSVMHFTMPPMKNNK